MDLSALKATDFLTRLKIQQMSAMNKNKDPNKVILMGFIGGHWNRQQFGMKGAVDLARDLYRGQGIHLVYHELTNDIVKKAKMTPMDIIDVMLSVDGHLVPAHFHQGAVFIAFTSAR